MGFGQDGQVSYRTGQPKSPGGAARYGAPRVTRHEPFFDSQSQTSPALPTPDCFATAPFPMSRPFPFPPRLRAGLVLVLVSVFSLPGTSTAAGETDDTAPSSAARPWTRWWWPGSAVDPAGLTAQLEAFSAAGLGGVEITPIYGARGAEARYREFLSPEWNAALAHTLAEAQRLGLQVDMATGTGWPFGGPSVAVADASHKLVLRDGELAGEPTAMQVKRAAPGGTGRVLDPYSAEALQRYLDPIGAALAPVATPTLRAQFHDSFEYYGAEWTPHLRDAFRTDHGYDLNAHAAALLGNAPADADTLARLKADYRTTLGRLHLDFLTTWRDWAHDHNWIVRNQSHGAPANLLDLYGAVDIPETETFGSTPFAIPGMRRVESEIRGNDDLPEPLMMKMASSAAHVMGRPLISSETCTWLREHWKVSLAMAKPEIDRLFANGINHVVYHGTVYSPTDAAWPGWLFYASTQFNPNNPWWDDFAALNAYVTRVQTALQSGQPDNEILLYWPYADVVHNPEGRVELLTVHHVDWLTQSPFGRAARDLAAAGFACDYISDAQLAATRIGAGGALITPGQTYRALVVPPMRHIPLATYRHLLELARAGAAIHFLAAPDDVPGLGQLDQRRAEFRELTIALHEFAQTDAPHFKLNRAGDRRIDSTWLAARATAEPLAATGLEYIRRRTDDGWIYFITNLTGTDYDGPLAVGVTGRSATLTDPLDGFTGGTPWSVHENGAGTARFQLAAGRSVLLHVRQEEASAAEHFSDDWLTYAPAGPARVLDGNWSLTFLRGGPVLPAAVALDAPTDWATLDDPDAQRFAGTGRYRLEFDLDQLPQRAAEWLLDLGDVRESARVVLNGEVVGTSWSLPHRLHVGQHLRAGRNVLEIDVTNLAANRIRDLDRRGVDWRIMHEINFVNIRYRPFDASDWRLTPSGLLGPVTLTPLKLQ